MKTVLQVQGLPDGSPTPVDGEYLKFFDFEFDNGRGRGEFTTDINTALQFDDMEAALAFYKTQPKCKPLRWDGRPNRPLTATNVLFEPVKESNGQETEKDGGDEA